MKGAKVKARGLKCTTNKKGKCTLHFPKLKHGKFNALATRKELRRRQRPAHRELAGHRTRTTDLPSVLRWSMSTSA